MEGDVFRRLKTSIDKLRQERAEVQEELEVDQRDLADLMAGMTKLTQEMQAKTLVLKEKERKLKEYEKMVEESERSYNIIVDTSNKLSSALENESNHLRSRVRKP
jgi:Skp family chaperone for outer membrane proteins